MAALITIWVVSGLCVLDAVRRPVAEWAEADREKSYWVMSLIISGLFALPALVFVPGYVLGVLPRFGSHGSASPHNPFAK